MCEFIPTCRLCGKRIEWGQQMRVVFHRELDREWEEYEHLIREDCK